MRRNAAYFTAGDSGGDSGGGNGGGSGRGRWTDASAEGHEGGGALTLVAHEGAGDVDLLAPHDDDVLAAEQLLGDERRHAPQQVAPGIHDGSSSMFADDIWKKVVVEKEASAEDAQDTVNELMSCLNEELGPRGFA